MAANVPSLACRLTSSKGQTGSNAGAQSYRADGDLFAGGSLAAERVNCDCGFSRERDCT